MQGPSHEPVAIFGMVSMLLLASAAPFALPVLTESGDAVRPAATPPGGSDPGLTPVANGSGPTATTGPTSTDRVSAGPATAAVDCGPADEAQQTPAGGGGGATGDGVAVAVVDPSGFAVDDPAVADQVAATASFDQRGDLGIRNDGRNRHGTASARLVARTAPDASLYLANFRTAHDFTRAVEWAIDRDVDVLVAPTVFYAKPNDGTAPVSRAVSKAAEAGITVVVPTGNVADRHWEGTYDGGGAVEFAPNDTRLYLSGDAGRAELWLWWNRSDDDRRHDFSVALYRETDDGPERIAESEEYPVGPVGTNQVLTEKVRTNDLLSDTIGNGTYFVRIEGPPNATHRVELVVPTHRLERPTARGSLVAPATADRRGVVAVGAGQRATGRPTARSGRGPTNDGRLGIDLLAPATAGGEQPFTGSSAAASRVGGVAALVTERNPSLSPTEVEAVLAATADGEGASLGAGHGMLDAEAALACAGQLEDG